MFPIELKLTEFFGRFMAQLEPHVSVRKDPNHPRKCAYEVTMPRQHDI